jgi:hypothetical protein
MDHSGDMRGGRREKGGSRDERGETRLSRERNRSMVILSVWLASTELEVLDHHPIVYVET